MLEAVIDDYPLSLTWEDNLSVSQLATLCAQETVRVDLSEYGGFELVGELGQQLVSDDHSLTATEGDALLYQSHSIVFMAGTNHWEYTRLGKVSSSDIERLKTLVGTGNATLEIRCATPQEKGQHE
ncbi:MAG TPA: hypothetical protein H9867_02025 [Candidatus Corynebacterium gallistercoris]|uniref:Cyclophilin-like domain-containing protein n=1 Tax=Candidatus Corynebacterium gallistercoris TaxID=2838530 RepID=A0A9D1RXC9_9CORY|nr:hypothetical protein [Candidatus Corynebacterium gallistercoris]